MRAFEKLPAQFQNDSVKAYYDILSKRQGSIILKRVFDIIVSLILLVFLIIPIAVISILIKVVTRLFIVLWYGLSPRQTS